MLSTYSFIHKIALLHFNTGVNEGIEKENVSGTDSSACDIKMSFSGTEEHVILFSENNMCVDDTWYQMSEEAVSSLKELTLHTP